MKWFVGCILTFICHVTCQQLQPGISNSLDATVNYQHGNGISGEFQAVKQIPYIEVLRLVQSFLRIKGELGGQLWALINDNSHILTALRDTLIAKISSIHNLTLKVIIILRKVLEFASALFGNSLNVNAGFTLG